MAATAAAANRPLMPVFMGLAAPEEVEEAEVVAAVGDDSDSVSVGIEPPEPVTVAVMMLWVEVLAVVAAVVCETAPVPVGVAVLLPDGNLGVVEADVEAEEVEFEPPAAELLLASAKRPVYW